MTEITIRIAKRLMSARLKTIKKSIDEYYDKLSNTETQFIYQDLEDINGILKTTIKNK